MDQETMVVDAPKLDVRDFIVKPFKPDHIMETVNSILGRCTSRGGERMGDNSLSLLFLLFGVAIILFGCYAFSKYATEKISTFSNSQNIKVLEKVPLPQDKRLVLAQICGKYYLIGFSSQSTGILQELSTDELKPEEESRPTANSVNLFQQARKSGRSVKSSGEFRGAEAGKRGGRGQNSEDGEP